MNAGFAERRFARCGRLRRHAGEAGTPPSVGRDDLLVD